MIVPCLFCDNCSFTFFKVDKFTVDSDTNSATNIPDLRSETPQQPIPSLSGAANPLRMTMPSQSIKSCPNSLGFI